MATITTIEATDVISDSRSDINTNFTNLNTDKLELSGGTMTGQLNFSGTTYAGIRNISLTTTERDALTPVDGDVIYNETALETQFRDNGAWVGVSSGVADASTTVKGISEIATDAELAAGTGTGGTGAVIVAAGSSFNETAAAGKVPVAESTGKIGEDWLGLTTAGDIVYSDGTDLQRLSIGTDGDLLVGGATPTVLALGTVRQILQVNENEDGVEWANSETTTTLTAGATINGATLPVPVYQNKTDNEFYPCDANDNTAYKFVGFATSNSTDANPIDVQFSGVVSGFTGLSEGEKYYVQDAVGTIGTTPGSAEILVGVAFDTDRLFIQKGQRYDSGTTNFSNTATTTITVGFRVSKVRISGSISPGGGSAANGKGFSNGGWTVAGGNDCIFGAADGDATIGTNATAWKLLDDNGNSQIGSVNNITDTTFDLANTESGVAETGFIFWEAFGEL